MALEHRLTATDTLFSLAERYFDDVSRWQEIADYNRLHAPYLVADRNQNRYASGYVTAHRINVATTLTVPAGWTFRTKPGTIGGAVKNYETVEATTLPAGEKTVYFYVRCTEPGTYGNIDARSITETGSAFEEGDVVFSSVTNEKAFQNARDAKYAVAGDILYIPVDDLELGAPENIASQLERLGGEDLFFTKDNDGDNYIPADGYGDLRSVAGVANILQAIQDRLLTEKGDYPLHPEYGTNLATLVGSARMPFTDRLVELEIYDALSFEDRITDTSVLSLEVVGTSIKVDLEFRPELSEDTIRANMNIDFTRG